MFTLGDWGGSGSDFILLLMKPDVYEWCDHGAVLTPQDEAGSVKCASVTTWWSIVGPRATTTHTKMVMERMIYTREQATFCIFFIVFKVVVMAIQTTYMQCLVVCHSS